MKLNYKTICYNYFTLRPPPPIAITLTIYIYNCNCNLFIKKKKKNKKIKPLLYVYYNITQQHLIIIFK